MESEQSKILRERDEALARVVTLEKENSKLKYRVQHLLRAVAEEEKKTEAGSRRTGGLDSTTFPKSPSPKHELSDRLHIASLLHVADYIGQTVTVAGWVRTMRKQAKFSFVELNDGSSTGNLQILVEGPALIAALEGLTTGASLMAVGQLVASRGKEQAVELRADSLQVLGRCDGVEYPLAKKKHTLEHLRSIAHLRPRTTTIAALARVRSALAYAVHSFYQERGFYYLHTPLITASDCEGAGEMFAVTTLLGPEKHADIATTATGEVDYSKDFFGKPSFLTVSGQLNGELYACALGAIYTFGPTFRAEDSHTTRHLAEFWMCEPEVAFANLDDNMNLAEDFIKYLVKYALTRCADDLKFFDAEVEPGLIARLEAVIAQPFERLTYTAGVAILQEHEAKGKKFEVKVEWGIDLGSEHERYLTEEVFKKPVILTNYPKAIKAFYMREDDDGRTVAAMDVLIPKVGEIIGGSQREERLDVLERRIKETPGLSLESYSHYLDTRRYGTVKHAGFGLGFERLLMMCTGLENIRDVIPFPRYPGHAEF